MAVFNSDGLLLSVVDDASVPGTRPDPVTGLKWDSAIDLFLTPGTYTLRVSQFDNFNGSGRSDFVKQNYPGYRDVTGAVRTNSYAVEVLTFRDIVSNVVREPFGSDSIVTDARFSLAETIGVVGSDGMVIKGAAEFGGFDHFNWFQEITSIRGNACRGPGVDPQPGGNCINQVQDAVARLLDTVGGETLVNLLYEGALADQAKWYWDETDVPGRAEYQLAENVTNTILKFEDTPGGLEVGTVLDFNTYLAGVRSGDQGALFASPTFMNTAFKWRYTQTSAQQGAVAGIEFFQNGFFDPAIGGLIEFMGYFSEMDWLNEAASLRSKGFELYGLDPLPTTTVSEPTTLALLGSGLLGLILLRRRKAV